MYYVYMRDLVNGRENYVGQYVTEKEAVCKIAACYKFDAPNYGFYYFMKKRG